MVIHLLTRLARDHKFLKIIKRLLPNLKKVKWIWE